MTLIEFQEKYAMEEACCECLLQEKWPDRFCCPKYNHAHAYCIQPRRLPLYECAACGYQPSLTVDTENTRTDLRKWFLATDT